jgi:hypothetical protein
MDLSRNKISSIGLAKLIKGLNLAGNELVNFRFKTIQILTLTAKSNFLFNFQPLRVLDLSFNPLEQGCKIYNKEEIFGTLSLKITTITVEHCGYGNF